MFYSRIEPGGVFIVICNIKGMGLVAPAHALNFKLIGMYKANLYFTRLVCSLFNLPNWSRLRFRRAKERLTHRGS